jgi:hypothetical protein
MTETGKSYTAARRAIERQRERGDAFGINLSSIPTEEFEVELARRRGHVWKGLADLQKRIEIGRCNKDGIVCPACMAEAGVPRR